MNPARITSTILPVVQCPMYHLSVRMPTNVCVGNFGGLPKPEPDAVNKNEVVVGKATIDEPINCGNKCLSFVNI